MKGTVMKKLALAIASIVLVIAPASAAHAKPKHHVETPVVSHVIDWD